MTQRLITNAINDRTMVIQIKISDAGLKNCCLKPVSLDDLSSSAERGFNYSYKMIYHTGRSIHPTFHYFVNFIYR